MTGQFLSPPYPIYDSDGQLVAAEDWLGARFTEGDQVIYCVTANPGGRMAIGVVQKIELVAYPRFSEVRVQVRTIRASGRPWEEQGPRTKPAWVTASNITALPVTVPVVIQS
jgi:hypothetical protein